MYHTKAHDRFRAAQTLVATVDVSGLTDSGKISSFYFPDYNFAVGKLDPIFRKYEILTFSSLVSGPFLGVLIAELWHLDRKLSITSFIRRRQCKCVIVDMGQLR